MWKKQSEKTAYCGILTIWHSGKGRSMETEKKSSGFAGIYWRAGGRMNKQNTKNSKIIYGDIFLGEPKVLWILTHLLPHENPQIKTHDKFTIKSSLMLCLPSHTLPSPQIPGNLWSVLHCYSLACIDNFCECKIWNHTVYNLLKLGSVPGHNVFKIHPSLVYQQFVPS